MEFEKSKHLAESQQALEVDDYTRYLDGLKDGRNRVIDISFIMQFREGVIFADLVEGFDFLHTATDYAGFHATDPNWYSEGHYQTGAVEPELYGQLETFFRRKGLLEVDQQLEPIIHFTEKPVGQHYGGLFYYENVKRADMVINVTGGERDDWGQFITCWLEDDFHPFTLNSDPNAIEELKQLAEETGKQEISFEEYWNEYTKRQAAKGSEF